VAVLRPFLEIRMLIEKCEIFSRSLEFHFSVRAVGKDKVRELGFAIPSLRISAATFKFCFNPFEIRQ